MTHYGKRCIHCKIKYVYQGSGEGCLDPLNDKNYCPECMHVINIALAMIPIKRELVWIETNEITVEYFKLLQIKQRKYCEENHLLNMVRVSCGRWIWGDKNTPSDKEIISFTKENGIEYKLSEWEHNYEPPKIKVAKEKDLETGEIIGYWL